LALIAVLMYHDGELRGGFLGVSTFFTLSGFLITGLLLAEWGRRGRISFGDFYARRLRRLAPAAILGLLVAAAIVPALREPSISHAFRGDALASLFQVANWRFLAAGHAYGAQFTTASPVLHYWSLAVEEQFYLVLVPVLVGLLVLARGRRRFLGAMVAALAVASFADGWLAVSGGSVDRAYYGTDTRALEFLVGALLAIVLARRTLSRGAARAVAAIGVPALVFLVWMSTHAQPQDASLFRGGLLAYALAGAALLVAVCHPGPLRWLFSLAPLRALGRISYGAYVYHWPLFLFLTAARTGLAPVPLTGLRFGATLIVATVSYHFIEMPIRTRQRTFGRRAWVVASAGAMAVVLASATVGLTAPALAVDFAPVNSLSSVLKAERNTTTTVPVVRSGGAPTTAAPSPKPMRVLVVGDSVALTLGRGIERWGARHGITVLNAGAIGCTLMDNDLARQYSGIVDRPADVCRTHTTWPVVLNEFRPTVVVALFGAWDVYDMSWDGGRTWSSAGEPVFDAHYLATMRDASSRLASEGAHVLWVTPPCFGEHAGDDSTAQSPWYDPARVAALGQMLTTVAGETRQFVTNVVHTAGCPVNYTTRPDGVHYSDAGADAMMPTLAPAILHAATARPTPR
jgi:peptidoglycan/LPS O-acetylase OafA/YrhL